MLTQIISHFIKALKREVAIMVEMVQCLDAFCGQQTRLVEDLHFSLRFMNIILKKKTNWN